MLSFLTKRKLTDEQLANIFVNSLNDVVEEGFKEVAAWINEECSFEKCPELSPNQKEHFLMIVIAANFRTLSNHFDAEQENFLKEKITDSFATSFDISEATFNGLVKDYDSFISRVNNPSKNIIYGMSKAVFHKYELHKFQQEYFRNLKAPNPVFLKKLDEIMVNFLWNWEAFSKKYKLQFDEKLLA